MEDHRTDNYIFFTAAVVLAVVFFLVVSFAGTVSDTFDMLADQAADFDHVQVFVQITEEDGADVVTAQVRIESPGEELEEVIDEIVESLPDTVQTQVQIVGPNQ